MIFWDETTTYTKDTIVSYNNIKYRAIKDVPENIRITDTEYWEQITRGTSVIGKVVPIPQGNWDSTKSYTKLDIVYNNGKSYIARKNVPATTPLPEGTNNTEFWQIIAEGTVGQTGPQGEPGVQGEQGNCFFPIFDVDFTNGELTVTYYDGMETKNSPTFSIDDNGDLNVEPWRE